MLAATRRYESRHFIDLEDDDIDKVHPAPVCQHGADPRTDLTSQTRSFIEHKSIMKAWLDNTLAQRLKCIGVFMISLKYKAGQRLTQVAHLSLLFYRSHLLHAS